MTIFSGRYGPVFYYREMWTVTFRDKFPQTGNPAGIKISRGTGEKTRFVHARATRFTRGLWFLIERFPDLAVV